MDRSTKDAWLSGQGDLKTEEVSDVPVKGSSVLVRALPARYSAQVSSQMKMVAVGRDQYATVDVAEMEVLQFTHGVVEPSFTEQEARQIQEKFGPAFKKVIEVIDRISGVDKEALEGARARFRGGDEGEAGGDLGNGSIPDGAAAGSSGPDVPARAGTGARDERQTTG